MRKLILTLSASLLLPSVGMAQPTEGQAIMPSFDQTRLVADRNDYATATGADRVTAVADRNHRGTSVPFKLTDVERLCGDQDGCTVRIAMHNWDDKGRVASRHFLFFYNPQNRSFRGSSLGGGTDVSPTDLEGTDSNNTVQHAGYAWGCYLTDGEYVNGSATDSAPGFGALSWTNYNGDCWITLIE